MLLYSKPLVRGGNVDMVTLSSKAQQSSCWVNTLPRIVLWCATSGLRPSVWQPFELCYIFQDTTVSSISCGWSISECQNIKFHCVSWCWIYCSTLLSSNVGMRSRLSHMWPLLLMWPVNKAIKKSQTAGGASLSQGNKSTLLCHCETVDIAVRTTSHSGCAKRILQLFTDLSVR